MKRIVILGGGFGGIRCALDLYRRLGSEAEIIIVDKRSYHTFTPSLYEVASAYREASGPSALNLRKSVSISYSDIFASTSVQHVRGEVAFVDVETKLVYLRHGKEIPYDYLVLALGSEATDFGIRGVAQHASFFKNIEDAICINTKLYSLFNRYLKDSQPNPIQIVLAGAGFTGIELASELASCLHKLGREHGINKKFFSIMVFEASQQMLPMLKTQERKIIMDRLTKIGVAVTDHSPIEEVHANHVKLADGHTWRGDLMIWTAGIKPNGLLDKIDIPLSPRKKIEVDPSLRVKGSTSIFALGDSIDFMDPQSQQPVPALAHTALEQAKVVAGNIASTIKNKPLRNYKPSSNSWAVPIGGKFVLVQINSSFWIAGFGGWLIHLWIDLRYFISILPIKKAIRLFKKELVIFDKNDEPSF